VSGIVRPRLSSIGGLVLMAFSSIGCATLPKLEGRIPTSVLTDTADTGLGRAVADGAAGKGDVSGIHPLANPREAFAARVVLARAAERSLDVQYYIWHADTAGVLLFGELWDAAERGVRVRLLLDDNNTSGMDGIIAALDSHPSIEVRLFNPFASRGSRALGYLTDFERLNHRMHNKSFTADGQVTIVGGRNVGDEYFAAGGAMVFQDLDVAGAGPVAAETGKAFDLYWNCEAAYPAELIVGKAAADGIDKLKARVTAVRASTEARTYLEEVGATQLIADLIARRLSLQWVPARLLYDDPVKVSGAASDEDLLFTRLLQAFGKPQRELDLISPYFVPGKKATAELAAYAAGGIRVRVLTNSLAATDVGAVHAGYAKRRKPLLGGGVKLYELKPDVPTAAAAQAVGQQAGKGGPGGSSGGGSGGSSAVSLHAKTFAVDRSRVFVGSFNFDPRSARLNTEMGVLIDNPALAEAISKGLDEKLPLAAYEVVLSAAGERLEWLEQTPQGEVRHTTEPRTGFFRRLGVGFMSLLPIESML
jgi:putative cardiolipin synthase